MTSSPSFERLSGDLALLDHRVKLLGEQIARTERLLSETMDRVASFNGSIQEIKVNHRTLDGKIRELEVNRNSIERKLDQLLILTKRNAESSHPALKIETVKQP